jgi:membrane carboxypeptidase/penicillin-binding protein
MDHREINDVNAYEKDLKNEDVYDEYVTIDGKRFRIPYKIVKEVTFNDVKKEELISIENAGRLQYRLMLLEPVLRAKVEFTKGKITVVYNPKTANNRKEKMSREELAAFFAKEGVNVSNCPLTERDFDYFVEMYTYQFDPPSIRERPPYGYTAAEWQNMKEDYNKKMQLSKEKSRTKFEDWQNEYAMEHPDVLQEHIKNTAPKKQTLKEKIFGGKKGKKKNEKGFWFHGV